MSQDTRIAEIQKTLEAIHHGWPFLLAHIDQQIAGLTEKLINNDNEQARGAIKELRRLRELPETLTHERDRISADLSEQDSAD